MNLLDQLYRASTALNVELHGIAFVRAMVSVRAYYSIRSELRTEGQELTVQPWTHDAGGGLRWRELHVQPVACCTAPCAVAYADPNGVHPLGVLALDYTCFGEPEERTRGMYLCAMSPQPAGASERARVVQWLGTRAAWLAKEQRNGGQVQEQLHECTYLRDQLQRGRHTEPPAWHERDVQPYEHPVREIEGVLDAANIAQAGDNPEDVVQRVRWLVQLWQQAEAGPGTEHLRALQTEVANAKEDCANAQRVRDEAVSDAAGLPVLRQHLHRLAVLAGVPVRKLDFMAPELIAEHVADQLDLGRQAAELARTRGDLLLAHAEEVMGLRPVAPEGWTAERAVAVTVDRAPSVWRGEEEATTWERADLPAPGSEGADAEALAQDAPTPRPEPAGPIDTGMPDWRLRLHSTLARRGVARHLREGLVDYVDGYVPPGDFLHAVLRNDLRGAYERADDESAAGLQALVMWLYNDAPARCWGSPERVDAWLAQRAAGRE